MLLLIVCGFNHIDANVLRSQDFDAPHATLTSACINNS